MKKRAPSTQKQLQTIWDRYKDTLWKIENSWNGKNLDYDKRTLLTDSVVEMIKIEKKLKSIEQKYIVKNQAHE